MIEKHKFQSYTEQEEMDKRKYKIFTVRLNEEEYEALKVAKKILKQPKDSTAFKSLAEIGTNVLHSDLTGKIIKTIFDNSRRNERLGINQIE